MPISWRPSGNKELAMSHVNEAARLLAVNRQMLTASPAHMNFKSFERLEDGTEILIRSFRPISVVTSEDTSYTGRITSIVDIKAPLVPVGREEELIKELVPVKDFVYNTRSLFDSGKWADDTWVEKRNNNDGSLIWASLSVSKTLWGMSASKDGVYACGWDRSFGEGYNWQIEKHDLKTGVLLWGVLDTSYISSYGAPVGTCCDDSGVYTIGIHDYNYEIGLHIWRVEKRDATNGNIIWVDWKYINNTNDTTGVQLGVDDDFLYVSNFPSGTIDCYNKNNGNIIYTQSIQFGFPNINYPVELRIDGDYLYVAALTWAYYDTILLKLNKLNGSLVWIQRTGPLYYDVVGLAVDKSEVMICFPSVGGDVDRFIQTVDKQSGSLISSFTLSGYHTIYQFTNGFMDKSKLYISSDEGIKCLSKKDNSILWEQTLTGYDFYDIMVFNK